MKKPAILLTLAAFLAVVGLLSTGSAPGASAAPDGRCPASASICTYRLPDHIQGARDACYRAEAAERGIPSGRDAYIAWWNSASASVRADWNQAFKACEDRNQLPGGKWAWDEMIYVGSR